MTADDDRLAPVTPLFGAPASDDALQSAVDRHPAGTGRADRRPTDASSSVDGAGDRPSLRALPTYAAFAATTEPGDEVAETGSRATEPSAFVRAALDTRSPAERRTDARIAARKQAEEAQRAPRLPAGSRGVAADDLTADGYGADGYGANGTGANGTGANGTGANGTGAGETGADGSAPETLEAAKQRAENISLHALSRRGVSSVEMARILTSRDLPDEVVALEIERLERVGLLDDTELAENLVRSKQERKGLGKGAITAELRQRGVAQEAIDSAIADIDDDDEQARCDEWAEKRVGQLRGLDHATAERRLNGYLMRRGYRSEVIRRSIEKVLPKGGSGGGVRFR